MGFTEYNICLVSYYSPVTYGIYINTEYNICLNNSYYTITC